jgi:hypothetical protein
MEDVMENLRRLKQQTKKFEEAKEKNHALAMTAGRNWNEKIEEIQLENPTLSYKAVVKLARKKYPALFEEYINTPVRINQDVKAYVGERG